MRSIRDTAFAFDRACRTAGVRYALVGGFAVMAWGQPRATMDVDALVRVSPADIEPFVGALAMEGLSLQRFDLESIIQEGGHATAFDEASSFHVDLKVARTGPEQDEVEGAAEVPFADGRLMVASAEDTVAYKLLFGTDQDVQDARSIVVRQKAGLDRARIGRLAARLGVRDRWLRLVDELAEADQADEGHDP